MNAKQWTLVSLALVVLAVGLCLSYGLAAAADAPPAAPPEAPPAAPPAAPPVAPPGAPPAAPPGTVEKAPPATTPGAAGEEAAPTETKKRTKTVFDTLEAGGWIGYIILLLSPIALAMIIEFSVSLRGEKMFPAELQKELEDYFNQEQYEEALELCNVEKNALTDVIRAGLSRIDAGYDRMQAAMGEAGETLSINLQQKASYLSLIGNIAPMLGLFGTVSGMIGAFGTIAEQTNVRPALLAGNINEALVTTFLGLAVAIPVMCAFQYFANRITRLTLEISTVVTDLMERFKPAK